MTYTHTCLDATASQLLRKKTTEIATQACQNKNNNLVIQINEGEFKVQLCL